MSDNVDKIDPASHGIENGSIYATPVVPAAVSKPTPWRYIGLGVLVLLSLLVVFVLPNVVSEYELPLEHRVNPDELAAPAASTPEIAISPFEEAQRALQRKEAQDVLAELLDLQSELEALDVESWGEAPYTAALSQAATGDEYYRTQEFQAAANYYGLGRDALDALLQTVPTVLSRTLIDAQNALDTGDSARAADLFSLARVLDPQNAVAQVGLTRARSLDDVMALLNQAEDQVEDNELEAARATLESVLDLDSYNAEARERLVAVDAQILENEFARIMSSGYAALDSNDPDAAIAEFQRAANLGINVDQAEAAIMQTENNLDLARINRLRDAIAAAEAEERWQDAVDDYDAVLAIDPNLSFAITGRDYASKRAQLDRLLVSAIANPARFAEDAVFQQTLDVYYTGRAIENPGPALLAQLDELQVLLENSQVPIEISLVSDNLTDVTVLRVADLGLFEQTTLSLKPGNYVAIGRRNGYREVREEFTVGFGQTPEQVIVRCDERVLATNGR